MSQLPDPDVWRRQRVFLTGHTGFKGGWCATWLRMLGAQVCGYALPPEDGESFFAATGVDRLITSEIGDIRDGGELFASMAGFEPTVVIHMAAQALVRRAYEAPVETFATNLMGTVHVLEAARRLPGVRAVLVVTTDKTYENREDGRLYVETDRLGGRDPYSASKACAELATLAWRQSYMTGPGAPALATVRAGNVHGGGDWARDRLVPDLVRAFSTGAPAVIRAPDSVRPWQHVLDPLCGYLLAIEAMLAGDRTIEALNFGPDPAGSLSVGEVAEIFASAWGEGARIEVRPDPKAPHEAATLRLDSAQARQRLGWTPRLDLREGLALSAAWYRAWLAGDNVAVLTRDQITAFAGKRPAYA